MNFISPEEAFGPTYAKHCNEAGLAYIQKYWLTNKEFTNSWEKKLDSIFKRPVDYPENIYMESFDSLKLVGGVLFDKEEFEKLKQLMKYVGDEYFVICEDTDIQFSESDNPPMRLRFPFDVEWEQMNSEDSPFSVEVFQISLYNVFVFGSSCKWGLYYGGDGNNVFWNQYSIWGTQSSCTEIFKELFRDEMIRLNPETWDYTPR